MRSVALSKLAEVAIPEAKAERDGRGGAALKEGKEKKARGAI